MAQAKDIDCKDKFSYAACGSLEKNDIDLLKKKFYEAKKSINSPQSIDLDDVQTILGFSGEQTKIASQGKIEDRIWIDQENCKRQVKASFLAKKLIQIKICGF
jgi:hypothetical protein